MVEKPTILNCKLCARAFCLGTWTKETIVFGTLVLALFMGSTLVLEIVGRVAPLLKQDARAQANSKGQAKKAEKQAEKLAKQAQQQAEQAQQQAGQAQQAGFAESQSAPPGQGSSQSNYGQQKKANNPGAIQSAAPPATVVEFFKRLIQPEPSVQSDAGTQPKRDNKSEGGGKPKRAKSQKDRINIALPSANSTFKQDEVLASDLNDQDLEQARTLGFKIESAGHFATLDTTITRLTAPSGLDALGALDLLRRELTGGRLALNRYYRVYRTARGDNRTGPDQGLRNQLPSRTKCTGDQCYGLSLIRWRPSLSDCTRSARIGVIDTPIDHRHPAITGKDVQVGTFVTGRRKRSADWHGTGVLALLTGDGNTTTPGLIPNASFYVADIFSQDAAGVPVAESVSLLQAFEWMDAFGVKIINLSLAGPKDPLVEQAIARLSKKGVIFIAAAGNDGPTAPPNYPAAYAPVIAVTAVNKKLRSYRYANRGRHIDFAAPGVGIWTAAPGQKEGYRSGTSFAVPFVTAVAATHYRQLAKPSKSSLLGVVATRDLGPKGHDKIYGRGLIQAPATCGGRQPGPQRAPAVVAESTSVR